MFHRRSVAILFFSLLVCGLLSIFLYLYRISIVQEPLQKPSRWPVKSPSSPSAVHGIYNLHFHPITSETFIGHTGKAFCLANPPRFTKPLGKKILILGTDTRQLDGPKGILSETPLNATELPDTSGRLNHFMFAMIHGYDYRLVQFPSLAEQSDTWTKVTAIKEALNHYEYVIFLDADAMIPYPNLPMEWLFNYWDINPNTLVAMALDPDERQNHDWNGRTLLNTGFIVAQQSPRTQELFEAWESCPTETRYPGCLKWGREWAHEQSAFGNYLRYDFNRSEDIRVLSCTEANGCPAMAHTGCVGELVRHYWGDKPSERGAVGDAISQYFLPQLHAMFYERSKDMVVNLTEQAFVKKHLG